MKLTRLILPLLAAIFALTACNSTPEADPESAARARELMGKVLPYATISTNDTAIVTAYNVDTLFTPDAMGYPIVEFLMSARLRHASAEDIRSLVQDMKDGGVSMDVEITNGTASSIFNLAPDRLLTLRKATRFDLDIPAVRAACVNLAERINAKRFAQLKGVKDVVVDIDHKFITYTIIWEDGYKFAKSDQGLLTARYMAVFQNQIKLLEKTFPSLTELINSTDIDGLRVQYAVGNEENIVVKEAFPWRVLL
ncbi:MAG: hypothetical protein K2M61_09080 [Muribaculaceae bacterium]|nr:hypothetical protein [Muribaculaceae bacterium]